jgi:hypothetical protein
MPSALHESVVTLFREAPRLGLALLERLLDLNIPEGAIPSITSAEFAELNPAEYRADLVLRVDDAGGVPEDIFIIEVQLGIDKDKEFSWPQYATGARARFRCPATLVVVALDEEVAAWCAQPIVVDRAGSTIQPVVISPDAIPVITDADQARALPELGVLSVIAHGRESGSEAIGLAALAGCAQLDNHRASLYADIVFAHLNEAARRALEALMAQHNYSYQSDFAKRYVEEGIEQGIEKGIEQGIEKGIEQGIEKGIEQGIEKGIEQGIEKGIEQGIEKGVEQGQRAILRDLLEQRFGALPEHANRHIEEAHAATLSLWARRVLTASSLADVFAGASPGDSLP